MNEMVQSELPFEEEIWKDVESHKGRYQVSNLGRVRSLQFHGKTRNEPLVLKQCNTHGYMHVSLVDDEINVRNYRVHILVAQAFIDKVDGKNQINHKNGKRDDNRVENLEFVTCRENIIHGWECNGRRMTQPMLDGLETGRETKLIRTFYHPIYGFFTGGCYEICQKYPDRKMYPSHFNELVLHPEKHKTYKGWRHYGSGLSNCRAS